jgi:hypothetical protein
MAYNPLDAFVPAYQTATQLAQANLKAAETKAAATQAASEKSAGTTPVTPGASVPSNLNFDVANSQITDLKNQINTMQTQNTAATNQLYSLVNAQTTQAAAAKQTQQTNWIEAGKQLLAQYDVAALGNAYVNLITTKGLDQSTAMLELQSTPEWKQRFSANESRLKQGLPILDPATYLATESAYKDVLLQAGVSNSVVNDTTYLGTLIAKDVSPVEVQQRVDAAKFAVANEDPYIKQQLQQEFGLTTGDMILHILDPEKASTVVAQKVTAAKLGAEFARQGVGIGMGTAEQYAAQGITQQQAQQAAINMAMNVVPTQELATRYGAFGPTTSVGSAIAAETLGTSGAAQAMQQLNALKTQEISEFSGSSGVQKGSLQGTQEGLS